MSFPIPRHPRHRKFADCLLKGMGVGEAYMAAGYRCAVRHASHAGCRVRDRPDVTAYLKAVQAEAARDACLTLSEIRRFLARIVRTPITALDPGDPVNADLIKTCTTTGTGERMSLRLEKLDPLKAIEMDLKLAGQDPETDAVRQIAEAIASLGGMKALPEEKL